MSSQVQCLQKQIVQLRQEADLERIPVSQAIEEMVAFIGANSTEDGLVTGLTITDNPFRDQKSCSIL